MALFISIPPAINPVKLDEVRAHLRISDYVSDPEIRDLIDTATERLDGSGGLLGLCLITQVWKLTLDRFTREIPIPLPPCQSIESVEYLDCDGVGQTLASSEYHVLSLGVIEGAKLIPAYGMSWPSTRSCPEAVTITFTAGFGDTAKDVPEPIRTNIKMYVAYLYDYRAGISMTDDVSEYLRNHRAWSF